MPLTNQNILQYCSHQSPYKQHLLSQLKVCGYTFNFNKNVHFCNKRANRRSLRPSSHLDCFEWWYTKSQYLQFQFFRIFSILVRISYLIILSQSLYGHCLSPKMEVCGYASIPIECYPFLIKTQSQCLVTPSSTLDRFRQ